MKPLSRYRAAGAAALLLALAACGEGYEADQAPVTANEDEIPPVTAPALPGNQQTLAEGRWEEETGGERAALRFVATGGEPVFRMACDDRGGILLERIGNEVIGNMHMMEVHSGGEVERLAMNAPEDEPNVLRGAVPYNHELMEPLARPDGRLSIDAGEGARLIVPLTPETAALSGQCRPSASASP